MSKENGMPYKALGDRIKFLREQWQQSLRELSSVLEIDIDTLKLIEAGKILPESYLLDMMINHFLLTEDQAEDLRELAYISEDKAGGINFPAGLEDMLAKQIVMFMPVDSKVVYTDAMNANVNDHGVMLQFMQQIPGNAQPTVVSRVGMSREHAEKVIRVLTQTLEQYDLNQKSPKQLPSPEMDNKKTKEKEDS